MAQGSLRERSFMLLQHLLPRRLLTRAIYRLTRIRQRTIRNLTIRGFVRLFNVDVSDAQNDVPEGYATFNDFFTRALRHDARPIDPAADALISPCDGTISQIGGIEKNRLLQAKGIWYSLEELLGGDTELASRFADGRFATIYLAPYNYHRIHMPIDGRLVRQCHCGTDLFSVNSTTAENVPRLFVRNERIVALFETAAGPLALIMVGALNVGSITTVWGGETRGGFAAADSTWHDASADLHRGDLAGWFNMGSTVILVAGASALEWNPELEAGARVRFGQRIATVFRSRND